jgi:SAM-dependent methyltransferase
MVVLMIRLASGPSHPLSALLVALEAAGEATRLRILALLAEAELTVSELMTILGQSQPRVSRHLKLLVEAGLIDRHREGAWAFFRLADRGVAITIREGVIAALDANDPGLAADRRRLASVRAERKEQAAAYFARHAADWSHIRALHVPESAVEDAIVTALGDREFDSILDLGTGTGQMLQLLGPKARRAVGLDVSPAMLSVARANLDSAGLRHVQLRQGDLYALPADLARFELVILHQVLHFMDDPARAVREAARVLKPGGRIVIVDFAPHQEESLRSEHAHRRLGFSGREIETMLHESGLLLRESRDIRPDRDGFSLTVSLWIAEDSRLEGDFPRPGDPLSRSLTTEVA